MTIQTCISQGSTTRLGPLTAVKVYPMKPGDKSLFVKVSDASGEAPLKIWGAPANCGLRDGQKFTLTGTGARGGIQNKEYPVGSGKWSLNASDCRIDIENGASVEHVGQTPSQGFQEPAMQYPTQPLAVAGDKLQPTMARAALATKIYVEELEQQGFTRDEALMLAVQAHSIYPLWWFGEKGSH